MAKSKPKPKSRGPSVNRKLVDDSIKHAVYLERYKNGVVRRVSDFLRKDVLPDLRDNLARRLANVATRGLGQSIKTNQRLKDLILSSNTILQAGMEKVGEDVNAELKDLALSEARWQTALVTAVTPIELGFIMPNVQVLKSAVTSRPMEGRLLKDWFKDLTKQAQIDITKQINIGIVSGESVDQMVRRVIGTAPAAFGDGIVGQMKRRAEGVVRTATSHVVNNARMETYNANEDVVKGWQYVATLDTRTCPICIPLDGTSYDVGDVAKMPPRHVNCRCTTVPVLKSFEELGLPFEEFGESTRASMDGQVSSKITYGEWLEGKSKTDPDLVADVLGKRRAELFIAGEVSVDEFTDDSGKIITLKELEGK